MTGEFFLGQGIGLSTGQLALVTSFFGVVSFVLGIIAELKKPAAGTPIQGKDVIIYKFQSDPTVALGSVALLAAILSAAAGSLSVFFPYKGKSVPSSVLFQNTGLFLFFNLAAGLTLLGAGMTAWTTITEALHHVRNVHQNLDADCATAKTGMFGGSAFLNLDACLFWLVSLMLALNIREDYFDESKNGRHLTCDL